MVYLLRVANRGPSRGTAPRARLPRPAGVRGSCCGEGGGGGAGRAGGAGGSRLSLRGGEPSPAAGGGGGSGGGSAPLRLRLP